jgi:hypothetical protein
LLTDDCYIDFFWPRPPTYDSEVDTTLLFVVHRSAFGLPDSFFEMNPSGLHVCYSKNMGEFGFVQTVEDNMKLFSKQ